MKRSLLLIALAAAAGAAQAKDLNIVTGSQSAFRGASEDAIAAIEYKPLGPAEWSGITGFEIAAIGAYVPTKHKDDWKTLTGQEVNELGLVGARLAKGLPFNFDVAAFYSGVPQYGVSIYGAELRYAILPGSTVMPALAIRGAWDKVSGLDDFDLHAYTVDASVSKGFAIFKPYLGAGYVWGVSDPQGDVATLSGLHKENIRNGKFFAGMRISLGLFHLTPEFEQVGSNQSYNLNVGIHW
jgi:hypothetical protein